MDTRGRRRGNNTAIADKNAEAGERSEPAETALPERSEGVTRAQGEGSRGQPEAHGARERSEPAPSARERARSARARARVSPAGLVYHLHIIRRMVGACGSMRTRASEASPRRRERRRAWRMAEGHRDKDAPRPTKQSTHIDHVSTCVRAWACVREFS